MTKRRSVWIDLTDLSAWQAHFTGTQRVTFEVAKAYYESDSQGLHFFVYDNRSRAFYELEFSDAVRNPPSRSGLAGGIATWVRSRSRHPRIKSAIKAQSLRAYRSLPFSVETNLTPARRDQLKRAYREVQSLNRWRKRNHVIRQAAKSGPPVSFSAQDTVLILGKPWDTMSFIDVLSKQRLQAPFKVVHLIHDMVPSFLPHAFSHPLPQNYTTYMTGALALSDQVIAVSESTKRDVIRFCKEKSLPIPAITVVRLGETLLPLPAEDRTPVADLKPGAFILCVGTVEIRKNHVLLYMAYREGVQRGIELPRLVIVGGKGWYTGDVLHELRNDPAVKDLVTVMHDTNDEDLSWLYRNCRFTIYPSIYEGWGLPVAESLAYGKVCISSDTSSMTEIATDTIDYFSPYNSAECLESIMRYMDETVLREKEKLVQKTYRHTPWAECASAVRRVVDGTN